MDDFITVGAPNSSEYENNVSIMKQVYDEMGTLTKREMDEGPATIITFLGIEINSVALEIRLPQAKLDQLRSSLMSWRRKGAYKKRLKSLVGLLSHACKAIRAGRTFAQTHRPVRNSEATFVCLNLSVCSDIEWWYQYFMSWNGISMMTSVNKVQPDITITPKASGSWGCGTLWGLNWFQLK